MRTSVFQYPCEKVIKRTKRALAKMGMRIVKSDPDGHSISAKSTFFSWKPVMNVVLNFEDMGNNMTRVTIQGEQSSPALFSRPVSNVKREIEILEVLSVAV